MQGIPCINAETKHWSLEIGDPVPLISLIDWRQERDEVMMTTRDREYISCHEYQKLVDRYQRIPYIVPLFRGVGKKEQS